MRDYFCGWYSKCQNGTQTVGIIPAFHRNKGQKTCSIQLITDTGSWNVTFPISAFRKTGRTVEIAGNRFGPEGLCLDLRDDGVQAAGVLRFGPLQRLKYDIMGPFRYVPFMECRHSVLSMKHSVDGTLTINGTPYVFRQGTGYLEGDRGRSFPKEYVWTQCCFPEGSLMLSVADIPLWGIHFTGIIGVICWQGRQYRLGTYWGAVAEKIGGGEVVIRQGRKRLTIRRLKEKGHPLAAPVGGSMSRTIHETAACRVYFHFQENGRTIFELESPHASLEYEYRDSENE